MHFFCLWLQFLTSYYHSLCRHTSQLKLAHVLCVKSGSGSYKSSKSVRWQSGRNIYGEDEVERLQNLNEMKDEDDEKTKICLKKYGKNRTSNDLAWLIYSGKPFPFPEPLTSKSKIEVNDKIRFFHGNTPARQYECGQQKGGNHQVLTVFGLLFSLLTYVTCTLASLCV